MLYGMAASEKCAIVRPGSQQVQVLLVLVRVSCRAIGERGEVPAVVPWAVFKSLLLGARPWGDAACDCGRVLGAMKRNAAAHLLGKQGARERLLVQGRAGWH